MAVTRLGSTRRRFRLPIVGLISGGCLLAALIMFALELARFANGRNVLQSETTVAGVPITGMSQSEAIAAWESIYNQPIELDYQGSPILLNPSEVGFTISSDLMWADIETRAAGSNSYWQDFWNYLWRRPTSPINVPLVADVQEPKLRSYLQDVAMRYDRQGTGVAFDPNLMTFNAGGAGYTLDIEASISLVREALMRPRDRYVRLVMQQQEGEAMSMDSLNQAIRQYLNLQRIEVDGPNYVVSVGVIDLETGKETWINPDVAYSSMSTIKIPILLNAFANLPFAPDNDVRWLMGASILCSNNSASNFLMQLVGEGANERRQMEDGLQKLMALMQTLGAPNTYINAPIFVDPEAQPWSIPAPVTTSLRTPDAKADLFSQTTAQDMGTLMQHIYDCAQYNSGLMAIAPDKFTASECQQILELLSGNVINRLIELGVPHGTKVAHKNGWGGAPGGRSGANVSDAAIVFSPGGDYVLVVYIWETFATESGTSTTMTTWETTEGISRIVYNYFNPDQPMLSSRAPINPLTAVDCVLPGTTAELDLTNIRRGRFDDQGNMLATACYGWPTCYTPPNVPIAPLPPQ